MSNSTETLSYAKTERIALWLSERISQWAERSCARRHEKRALRLERLYNQREIIAEAELRREQAFAQWAKGPRQ